jgi:hypothetical protein
LKIFIIFISIFFLCSVTYAQKQCSKTSDIQFLPSTNLFEPVKASVIEAKNGVIKDLNRNNLILNIGISSDIIRFNQKDFSLSLGADFFTYSNLRSEPNFKFPVDAIDYFFGLNFNYRKQISDNKMLSARMRISHISAHFEDGHSHSYLTSVYSREFVDLAFGFDLKLKKNIYLKNNLSFNYLFHSIPDNFGNISLQYGFEFRYFTVDYFSIYFSNDIKYLEIANNHYLNESMETGIRFGKINSKGISISFNYYDGRDFKGQYYNSYLNYKGIGINFEL